MKYSHEEVIYLIKFCVANYVKVKIVFFCLIVKLRGYFSDFFLVFENNLIIWQCYEGISKLY